MEFHPRRYGYGWVQLQGLIHLFQTPQRKRQSSLILHGINDLRQQQWSNQKPCYRLWTQTHCSSTKCRRSSKFNLTVSNQKLILYLARVKELY